MLSHKPLSVHTVCVCVVFRRTKKGIYLEIKITYVNVLCPAYICAGKRHRALYTTSGRIWWWYIKGSAPHTQYYMLQCVSYSNNNNKTAREEKSERKKLCVLCVHWHIFVYTLVS